MQQPTVSSSPRAIPGRSAPAAPPAVLPLSFLGMAGAGIIGVGVAAASAAASVIDNPTGSTAIAVVHTTMLAFLATALLAAMHQFVPVISSRPARSNTLSWITLSSFSIGVWLLIASFATRTMPLLAISGSLLVVAVFTVAFNLWGPLWSKGKGTSIVGLRLAMLFFCLTAAFGGTYALGDANAWFAPPEHLVLAHATLGLIGFLGLGYISVGEKLWPMFLLAHRPKAQSPKVAVAATSTGAILLATGLATKTEFIGAIGGGAILIGIAAHITSLAGYVKARKRRLEMLHAYIFLSTAFLLVAVGLAVTAAMPSISTASRYYFVSAAVASLAGWLGMAIVGHAHKIVPFITYTTLRARGLRVGPTGSPLTFADLFSQRFGWFSWVLVGGGFVAVIEGLAASSVLPIRLGGVGIAVGGAVALANLALWPRMVSARIRSAQLEPMDRLGSVRTSNG